MSLDPSDASKIILLKKLYPYNFKIKKNNNCVNFDFKESELVIGTIMLYASNKIPDNWLLCDGSILNINEYKILFYKIGTTFGGDGINTFNLPDFRGNVPIGANNNYLIGNSGGEEKHTLLINELPEHNFTGITSSNGKHNHTGSTSLIGDHTHNSNSNPDNFHDYGLIHKSYGGNNTSNGINLGEKIDYPDIVTTPINLNISAAGSHLHNIIDDGDHTHTFSTTTIGSNTPYNIMQPYLVINYLIKVK
jgi:microcystin-dependent protein